MLRSGTFAVVALVCTAACGTVDLGDNFVAPDVRLDEDFFYCRVQPEVIAPQRCASGGDGEGGGCHDTRSALRLLGAAEDDPPPECDGDIAIGDVPASYRSNFEAIKFTVQSDPLSSPLYRRPVGLDSHPRTIFPENDPAAELIFEWISRGAQ